MGYHFTTGNDNRQLLGWLNAMRAMTEKTNTCDKHSLTPSTGEEPNITALSHTLFDSNIGHTCLMVELAGEASSLQPAALDQLLETNTALMT